MDRLLSQSEFSPQYQELKFILHRKLLDRINLEMLSSVAVDRVLPFKVRSAVARLVEDEKTPLTMMEKDRIIGEVLDEVFGLGPLEPLLADPTISDILVTTPKLVYIERAGKLYKTARYSSKTISTSMRIIEKIVARVGSEAAWTNPRRWWTRGCPTDPASMLRFRRSRLMDRCSRFAASGATRSKPRT